MTRFRHSRFRGSDGLGHFLRDHQNLNGFSFDGLVKSMFSPKDVKNVMEIFFNINKLTLRALFTP